MHLDRRKIIVRKHQFFLFPLLVLFVAVSGGCFSGAGTLADYFGWESLGGTWLGTLNLSDGRKLPLVMTFTEFDGESFHVKVEAGEGDEYINNQADADYGASTRYFQFDLLPFFGGPCHVTGSITDKYSINGNMSIDHPSGVINGYYDLSFPH